MSNVIMVKLGDVLEYEQPTKYIVQSTNYNKNYKTPVLTAGQTFVLGYIDETQNIFSKNLPVIIFDDFTTAIKLVDFPFKVKSSAMKILKAKKEIVNIKYAYYFMSTIKTDTQLHKRYWISQFANLKIPLPAIEEQTKITNDLDKLNGLIELRKQQIEKLDQLIKSRFIEMFGDPVKNPMKWPIIPLMEIGYCKNGMNFHDGDSGVELHCLGVGDFKNYAIIDGTERLPIVSLNEMPSKDCMLQDDDIVFVRSNGNKTLVGRCLAVYPHDTPTIYSGFCIRYRKVNNIVQTHYLLRVLKSNSMRKKMFGRGANIQNLNQQILASLSIPIPPQKLQNQFTAFIEHVDRKKFETQRSLEKLEILKNVLMQQYFG